MSANEGLQKIADTSGMPVDPNVRVPDHVRQAAEAAEAIHKANYAKEIAPAQQAEPGIDPQPSAAEIAARAAEPQPQAAQVQQQVDQPIPQSDFVDAAPPEALRDSEWARRYNSMRGRYDAQVRANSGMEEQMRQLAVELQRTQTILANVQASPVPAAQPAARGQDHGNLITDADREAYGDDLIDLSRRAAREAVGPELDNLRAENQRLTQRVQSTGKREMFSTLDGAVPNWRAINKAPQFLAWLRLPNVYTGQPRGKTLNDAVQDANASKAAAIFKDFLAEAAATGQQVPAVSQEQLAPAPAPHVAALALDTLAAPGRARPASGDTQVPASKPNYTRGQISKFYDDKRRGLYAGRDAEVIAFEADLTAAQREGRIQG